MFECFTCVSMYMCITCMPGTLRGEKRGLELWTDGRTAVGGMEPGLSAKAASAPNC